jgi:hypothetical protein
LTLKDRKLGQGSFDELKERDFKAELLKREAELKNKQLKNSDLPMIQGMGIWKCLDIKEDNPDLVIPNKAKIRRPGQQDE